MKTKENIDIESGKNVFPGNHAEYYQQFAANSDDVFAIWTPAGEVIYINDQFSKIFHRNNSETKNRIHTILDWIHPDDLSRLEKVSDNFRKFEFFETSFRFRIILPDKSLSWLWYRGKALRNSKGEIYQYISVISDINDFKKTQKDLFIKGLSLDSNKNALMWFRKNASIIYANTASEKLYGYSEKEFYSLKAYELFDDDISIEKWIDFWTTYKASGISSFEQKHRKKDGTVFIAELKLIFFKYEGAEYIFAHLSDVSERKNLENTFVFRQEFERLLFNISARFINLSFEEVDKNIDTALKEICEFSQKDSAYIFFIEKENKRLILKHYYSSEESKRKNAIDKYFQLDENSWHYKALCNDKIIRVDSVQQLDQNDNFRKVAEENNFNSFVDIGLFYQNELIGFFGLAACSKEVKWKDDEINLLKVIANIFINASQRKEALTRLEESEKTYREIYNVSVDAIVVHNAETGKILDVNQAMLNMFEITYEEALNANIEELSDTSDESFLALGLERIKMASQKPQVFEWKCKSKSGKSFWTEVTLSRAEIHGTTRILALVRDIDDRKITEGLLKKSEEQYRMIIEGQNDLIVKIDLEGRFNFVSLSYCKMFGKSEDELIGQKFMPLVHEDDQMTTKLAMENLYSPPHSCYIEQRAKTASGWKWLAWNDTAVLNTNGEVSEIIGVGRDITYQKMVENALRESEEQFRSIVQNLSDVVFLLDDKGNIKYVTPSCEECLGHTIEELLGYSIFDLIHDEDRWLAEENIQLHSKGNDYTVPYEVRMKHYSSTWRIFEVKSQSMLNHPSVRSIIYTISDISERKLMEKQVLDAIIKTEEKERERFAKDLHDDLGPLLSSIKMYIGMLDKTTDKEKQKYIINNLYDIVKESIATTKDVSNDLNPHVLNNYGLISAIELFIEKVSSEVQIDFEQNLDSSRYAPAIELSLYRISKELINNTIKHANAQQIRLNYKEKNARLSLFYEDDGIGLPPNALKVKKPGGMGLSNIISRAKSLNASYNFHVKSTKGFKFEMHVPLIQD